MAERYQARSVLPRSFRCLPDTRRLVQGTILATRYPERCWGFALPRRFSQVLRERHSRVQCKFGEMSVKSMKLVVEVPPTVVRMRVVARDSTNGNMGTADLTPEGEQFH